jgi:hypothetical protein
MSEKLSPSEAVIQFAAWLSASQDSITIGSMHDCTALAEIADFFCKDRDLYPTSIEEVVVESQAEDSVFIGQDAGSPQKHAAPLENPKGLSWFDGTSWGSK